jgi:hypothetical protein
LKYKIITIFCLFTNFFYASNGSGGGGAVKEQSPFTDALSLALNYVKYPKNADDVLKLLEMNANPLGLNRQYLYGYPSNNNTETQGILAADAAAHFAELMKISGTTPEEILNGKKNAEQLAIQALHDQRYEMLGCLLKAKIALDEESQQQALYQSLEGKDYDQQRFEKILKLLTECFGVDFLSDSLPLDNRNLNFVEFALQEKKPDAVLALIRAKVAVENFNGAGFGIGKTGYDQGRMSPLILAAMQGLDLETYFGNPLPFTNPNVFDSESGNTPLGLYLQNHSSRLNLISSIQLLIASKADVTQPNLQGMSPVASATLNEDPNVLQTMLLTGQVKPDYRINLVKRYKKLVPNNPDESDGSAKPVYKNIVESTFNGSLVRFVAERGTLKSMAMTLEHFENNVGCNREENSLHALVKRIRATQHNEAQKWLGCLQKIVRNNSKLVNYRDSQQLTPLALAAELGERQAFQAILEIPDADVDASVEGVNLLLKAWLLYVAETDPTKKVERLRIFEDLVCKIKERQAQKPEEKNLFSDRNSQGRSLNRLAGIEAVPAVSGGPENTEGINYGNAEDLVLLKQILEKPLPVSPSRLSQAASTVGGVAMLPARALSSAGVYLIEYLTHRSSTGSSTSSNPSSGSSSSSDEESEGVSGGSKQGGGAAAAPESVAGGGGGAADDSDLDEGAPVAPPRKSQSVVQVSAASSNDNVQNEEAAAPPVPRRKNSRKK